MKIGKLIDRTEEIAINSQNLKMKILNYRKNNDIDVIFEDGYISYNKEYQSFKKGNINNPNHIYCKNKNRVGEIIKLKCGATAKIIQYKDANDITVKILETNEIFEHTLYKNFKERSIKSKFFASVCNHGYLGHEITVDCNGNQLQSYKTWVAMIKRCYSEKYQERQPTYKDCSVCDEWLNYSNFKHWFNENYYMIPNKTMALDKDILHKGNKIYSSKTCVFVPQEINSLFVKNDINRGKMPIGIYYDDSKNYTKKYKVSINNKNKRIYLGYFLTLQEAFNVYKSFKEQYIKQVADDYKEQIPLKLYEAMYNWIVEITD